MNRCRTPDRRSTSPWISDPVLGTPDRRARISDWPRSGHLEIRRSCQGCRRSAAMASALAAPLAPEGRRVPSAQVATWRGSWLVLIRVFCERDPPRSRTASLLDSIRSRCPADVRVSSLRIPRLRRLSDESSMILTLLFRIVPSRPSTSQCRTGCTECGRGRSGRRSEF